MKYKVLMSPWVVMPVSVVISFIIYLIVATIYSDLFHIGGFALSIVIPASISFPISALMVKYHSEIESQKNELEALDNINKRLFSTITHDIRSPISTVSMLIDLLNSNSMDAEETKKQLIELSSNIDILLQFLDEILIWSKNQIDKKPLQPEFFDTKEVIDNTLALYKSQVSNKNIEIITYNKSASLFADKGSYSFCFRNVLHNSIKFTPKGGTINIMVLEDDVKIVTEIKDSGIGMDDTTVSNILKNMSNSTKNGTNNEKGTGFGLRTTMDYLNKHNGKLEIDSTLGVGTRIVINLPKPLS